MTNTSDTTTGFFDRYAAALLARDEASIAALYAVPALILFPGQSIAVSDAQQTEVFFAASWAQYDGVDVIDRTITVIKEGRAPSGRTSPGPTAAPASTSATSSSSGRTGGRSRC